MERIGKWFLFVITICSSFVMLWRLLNPASKIPSQDMTGNLMIAGCLLACLLASYVFGRELGLFPNGGGKPINKEIWRLNRDLNGNYRKYVLVINESQGIFGHIRRSRWFETLDGRVLKTEPDDDDARALLRTFEFNKGLK